VDTVPTQVLFDNEDPNNSVPAIGKLTNGTITINKPGMYELLGIITTNNVTADGTWLQLSIKRNNFFVTEAGK
jgi:hypothetical protein